MLIQTPGPDDSYNDDSYNDDLLVFRKPSFLITPSSNSIQTPCRHTHLHYSSAVSYITPTCVSALFSPHNVTSMTPCPKHSMPSIRIARIVQLSMTARIGEVICQCHMAGMWLNTDDSLVGENSRRKGAVTLMFSARHMIHLDKSCIQTIYKDCRLLVYSASSGWDHGCCLSHLFHFVLCVAYIHTNHTYQCLSIFIFDCMNHSHICH